MNCNQNIRILKQDGTCEDLCVQEECPAVVPTSEPEADGCALCSTPDCPPACDLCCQGINPDTASAGMPENIFTYVTKVVDVESSCGTGLNEQVSLTPQNCSLLAEYTSCNGCCTTQPTIDDTACFRILSYDVRIESAYPTEPLTGADFLLNNIPASAAIANGRNAYEISLSNYPNDIYNDFCTDKGKLSSAALVVAPAGTTITYEASFVICGTVSTSSGLFKFKYVIRTDEPITGTGTTTFMLPKICLSQPGCFDNPRLLVTFCYDGQLIAPALTADATGQITFTSGLLLKPAIKAETVTDKKVILNVREIC